MIHIFLFLFFSTSLLLQLYSLHLHICKCFNISHKPLTTRCSQICAFTFTLPFTTALFDKNSYLLRCPRFYAKKLIVWCISLKDVCLFIIMKHSPLLAETANVATRKCFKCHKNIPALNHFMQHLSHL